jgi:hypothetical protein
LDLHPYHEKVGPQTVLLPTIALYKPSGLRLNEARQTPDNAIVIRRVIPIIITGKNARHHRVITGKTARPRRTRPLWRKRT